MKALVNTGCTTTLVTSRVMDNWGGNRSVRTVDGSEMQRDGTGMVERSGDMNKAGRFATLGRRRGK